jgi:hypothetical protein
MKRKVCLIVTILSGCLLMVFAANVDPCTEKYNSCIETCGNLRSQCKARGSAPEACEFRYRECVKDCEKAMKACRSKKKS